MPIKTTQVKTSYYTLQQVMNVCMNVGLSLADAVLEPVT
jgi:hypothetical protein